MESPRVCSIDADRSKRVCRLLESGKFNDLTLCVGPDREEIPTARIVLASASDVFEAMFMSEMQEGRAPAQIEIPDILPGGMQAVIAYAATGETDVPVELVVPAFLAARKYEVGPVRDACLAKIKNSDMKIVLRIMDEAARNGDEELKHACATSSCLSPTNMDQVLASEEFMALSEAGLHLLLAMECCQAVSSPKLWEACKKWARCPSAETKDAKPQQTFRSIAHLLPTFGLSPQYLASLNEDGLLAQAQLTAALKDIGTAISMSGAWLYKESEATWYTVEFQGDGQLMWYETPNGTEETLSGPLRPTAGWYTADLGHGKQIRVCLEGDKMQSEYKESYAGEWGNSYIARRWR